MCNNMHAVYDYYFKTEEGHPEGTIPTLLTY